MKISVHVLTKNCDLFLGETLSALRAFPEVIVYDTGSTDKTIEIASLFPNVVIQRAPLTSFGKAHNDAAALSSNDWILSIDSDEVMTEALVQEITALELDPACVYAIERENYYNGQKVRWCAGWHPDWVTRLYNKKTTSFSNDIIHEKVVSEGFRIIKLKNTLKHVPYRSTSDFLNKMQTYSTFFAVQHQGKRHSSLPRALLYGLAAFCKNYFLKRGILGGKTGVVISLYNAQTTYYKYLKLAELNKKL